MVDSVSQPVPDVSYWIGCYFWWSKTIYTQGTNYEYVVVAMTMQTYM